MKYLWSKIYKSSFNFIGENIYEIFRYSFCMIIDDDTIDWAGDDFVKIKTRKSKIFSFEISFWENWILMLLIKLIKENLINFRLNTSDSIVEDYFTCKK